MAERHVAACAEFPNDNPDLHSGSIWCCLEVRGEAVCTRTAELPAVPQPSAPPTPPEPGEPREELLEPDDGGDIEVVDDLVFDDAVDDALAAVNAAVDAAIHVSVEEAASDPDEDPADDPIDDLVVATEPPTAPEEATAPTEDEPWASPADDPFATLARVVEEVCCASGGGEDVASRVRALLGLTRIDAAQFSESSAEALVAAGVVERSERGLARAEAFARQVIGWQGVLRGESEDFDACGSAMLDEWCANLVARAMGQPGRAEGLRRELRRRGVAAFGLVADAA